MRARASASGALILVMVVGLALPSSAYRRPGTTQRVNVAPDGAEANHPPLCFNDCFTSGLDLSDNGRFVAFASLADNLVENDRNLSWDVFLYDRRTRKTQMVSVNSAGAQSICPYGPTGCLTQSVAVSANGRYIAFTSHAINLVPSDRGVPGYFGDTNLEADIFVHDRKNHTTERVSVATGGKQVEGHGGSIGLTLSMTNDGRYVLFASAASNLVLNDTNNTTDVFVHDRLKDRTERVSIGDGAKGAQGDGASGGASIGSGASITPNGRYVVFSSTANNLVANDDDGEDTFIRDRKNDTTTLVSTTSSGTKPHDQGVFSHRALPGYGQSISDNGRYVVFGHGEGLGNTTGSFVPNRGFSGCDVFVKDLKSGRTERVSVASDGTNRPNTTNSGLPGNALSCHDSQYEISPDGRYVTFASNGAFAQDDGDSNFDVYIHDRHLGITELVARSTSGAAGTGASRVPNISSRGRDVAFISSEADLVPFDDNAYYDVFMRHRGDALGFGGAGSRSGSVDATPSNDICILDPLCIPPLGYLFAEDDADEPSQPLGPGANLIGAGLGYRPHLADLFVVLEIEQLSPVHQTIGQTPLYGFGFSIDGVSYEVRAQAVPADHLALNGGALMGLFRCDQDPACTKVVDLFGGYGTTGERVVFSVPLSLLGLNESGSLSHAQAFSAVGDFYKGAVLVLDQVELEGEPKSSDQ